MIKKFNEFINEDFTDLYKRWKDKEVRKEDSLEVKMKDFITSRNNPQDYYIENGLVCCKGDVIINNNDLVDDKFPFKFGKVDRTFDCYGCENLTSLEGAPEYVGESFYCYDCDNLTSLEGAPKEVGGSFYCYDCDNLTSLEGAPEYVGGCFSCARCFKLKSLEGAPKEVGGSFYCYVCGKKFTEKDIPEGTIIKGKFKNIL